MNKKLISIIIPIYNERENLPHLYKKLTQTLMKLTHKYDFEILMINDGSKDKSDTYIEKLANHNPTVKYIEFSRNFGKEIATSAGLNFADGDAVILMDADLQFPPSYLPEFLKKWEQGNEVVTGIRIRNKGEGIIKKYGSIFYNKFITYIIEHDVIPQSTDFRLLDRKVVKEFNKFTERNRITRGLIDWLGFRRDYVHFEADERLFGTASYSISKLIKLATSSIVSLSSLPLKIAGFLGATLVLVFGVLGLFIFIEDFILQDPLHLNFSGPAILAVISLFSSGIVLLCLGIIALYIEQIHIEATNRPMFVIRKTSNINKNKLLK